MDIFGFPNRVCVGAFALSTQVWLKHGFCSAFEGKHEAKNPGITENRGLRK